MNESNEGIEEIDYKPVDVMAVSQQPRRIALDAKECEMNRLGSIVKDIPFTDYSVDPPEELVFVATITAIPIEQKKALLKLSTKFDRAGIPEIDWERFDDLLLGRTFGYNEEQWRNFTKTHPIGLYTKLTLIAKEINGSTSFSKEDLDKLKNLAGQDQ